MARYICSVCGYVYDEAMGDPKNGVPAGTAFRDLPDAWLCPTCGAEQTAFDAADTETGAVQGTHPHSDEMRALSAGELGTIFSNLSKGCEKQYLTEESELFGRLSVYYLDQAEEAPNDVTLKDLSDKLQSDLSQYPSASQTASAVADRGALRSLVWSEKVTRILGGMIPRYAKKGESLLEEN
ncbi:MAG: rubredoxin, partial [Eubacteriales bacterium]